MEKTLCCGAHFSMFDMQYIAIMRKAKIFVKEKIEKKRKIGCVHVFE